MREVYKWKSRLSVHGGQQVHVVKYWETYALVVSWPTQQFFHPIPLTKVENQTDEFHSGLLPSAH